MRDAEEHDSREVPFPTTIWTDLGKAGRDSPLARCAVAKYYWLPVYSWLRRKGLQSQDAQDHTQAFFVWVLESRLLGSVERERGRFRNFLLTCLQNFMKNERDRAETVKRCGGKKMLSLDVERAELALGVFSTETPEREFGRQWALAVLGRARKRLSPEMGKLLDSALERRWSSLEEFALRIGLAYQAARKALRRAGDRLRELIKLEIAGNEGSSEQVALEMDEVLSVIPFLDLRK